MGNVLSFALYSAAMRVHFREDGYMPALMLLLKLVVMMGLKIS